MQVLLRRFNLIVIFLLAACAPAQPAQPTAGRTVVYTVTNSGGREGVSLTYKNASGGTEQVDARPPWTLRFTTPPGAFAYVAAQKKGTTGTVRCEITVNGQSLQQAASSSDYGIASCSGTVP